jgi:hypothetical protein
MSELINRRQRSEMINNNFFRLYLCGFFSNVLLLDKYFYKFCILLFVTANGFSAIGAFIAIKVIVIVVLES